MARCFSPTYLRRLRNQIPIAELVADILETPVKWRHGRLRFLCPLCGEFDTATNPKTNLARCFRCKQNFNPIDLTMIVRRLGFRDAVAFLDPYLEDDPKQRDVPHSPDLHKRLI